MEKNASETYGMLQTAFRLSCTNRASVFQWHKRFKEDRESVSDDERCGSSKEVRTPELMGQIKNFIDKDRRLSIETISAQFDVIVGAVHTIIREELKMWKIWSSWSIQIPQFLMLWWPAMKAGSTAMTQRPRNRVPSGSMLALADPRRPDRANHPQTFEDPFFDSTGMIYMHWVPTGQTVNKEYNVEVLREFRRIFRRKRPALFKSGQWHFHQDNAPVHNSILVTDYFTKIVQTLLPVAFGYSLSSRKNLKALVMRQLRRWKKLWRRSLTHKMTSMGSSRSYWNSTSALSRRRLLQRGLEFHVCTIKKIPIQKSLETD